MSHFCGATRPGRGRFAMHITVAVHPLNASGSGGPPGRGLVERNTHVSILCIWNFTPYQWKFRARWHFGYSQGFVSIRRTWSTQTCRSQALLFVCLVRTLACHEASHGDLSGALGRAQRCAVAETQCARMTDSTENTTDNAAPPSRAAARRRASACWGTQKLQRGCHTATQ